MTRDEADRIDELRVVVAELVARHDTMLPHLATREHVTDRIAAHAHDCAGSRPRRTDWRSLAMVVVALITGTVAIIVSLVEVAR